MPRIHFDWVRSSCVQTPCRQHSASSFPSIHTEETTSQSNDRKEFILSILMVWKCEECWLLRFFKKFRHRCKQGFAFKLLSHTYIMAFVQTPSLLFPNGCLEKSGMIKFGCNKIFADCLFPKKIPLPSISSANVSSWQKLPTTVYGN